MTRPLGQIGVVKIVVIGGRCLKGAREDIIPYCVVEYDQQQVSVEHERRWRERDGERERGERGERGEQNSHRWGDFYCAV